MFVMMRWSNGLSLLHIACSVGAALLSLALRGVGAGFNMGPVGRFLSEPLVTFLGWPAAALVPAVPAVPALRLFGRMESGTDRAWMIFFAGGGALPPIAICLGAHGPQGGHLQGPGLWGGAMPLL